MPLTRERPLPELFILPNSPPLMYTPQITTSPTSYFSPSCPVPSISAVTDEPREIIMGGLVSRSVSSASSSSTSSRRGSLDSLDEKKRSGSIEVPGIILTEPHPDPCPRRNSPPPKSFLLLPPASLPIPDELPSKWSQLSSILKRRPAIGGAAKSAILLVAIGLGGWHIWNALGSGGWADEMSGLVEEVMA